MPDSVQFNDELRFSAIEVCNITINNFLPLKSDRIRSEKLIPELFLLGCHILTQVFRPIDQLLVVRQRHLRSLLPALRATITPSVICFANATSPESGAFLLREVLVRHFSQLPQSRELSPNCDFCEVAWRLREGTRATITPSGALRHDHSFRHLLRKCHLPLLREVLVRRFSQLPQSRELSPKATSAKSLGD